MGPVDDSVTTDTKSQSHKYAVTEGEETGRAVGDIRRRTGKAGGAGSRHRGITVGWGQRALAGPGGNSEPSELPSKTERKKNCV